MPLHGIPRNARNSSKDCGKRIARPPCACDGECDFTGSFDHADCSEFRRILETRMIANLITQSFECETLLNVNKKDPAHVQTKRGNGTLNLYESD